MTGTYFQVWGHENSHTGAAHAPFISATDTTAPAAAKARICLVLPKAQLGQGSSGADVGEPVRQTLAAYLGGPATEIIPLTARIPIQIDAEAVQTGCGYVLYTSVAQKKGGGGFGNFMKAAGPLASALPMVGGMGGSYGTVMATQAVATAASSAAASSAAQEAQEQAMAQISGASQSNIRKGDQITFEYTLMKPGQSAPFTAKSTVVKATENGQDLLSPLIEQTATEVLTRVMQPPSTP